MEKMNSVDICCPGGGEAGGEGRGEAATDEEREEPEEEAKTEEEDDIRLLQTFLKAVSAKLRQFVRDSWCGTRKLARKTEMEGFDKIARTISS